MDDEDVELQELDSGSSGGVQSVRKNISLKLKGKTKPKTKSKNTKSKKLSKKEDSDPLTPVESYKDFQNDYDIDADISKLKPPTFTTLERGPSEPLHKNTPLRWDYKVNLIGEKVVNPMIHCCEKCTLPILIYGRMIPCKHIFCTACARRAEKVCPRCKEKVIRVETTGLGTVFLCTYGGSRHGNAGCRRTYLSQRDLQAHVSHRHLRMANVSDTQAVKQGAVSQKGEYENREGHPQYLSSSGAVHVGHDMSAAAASHDPRLAYHRDDVAAMAHMIPQQTHIQYTTVPTPAVSPAVVAPGTQQAHAYPGTGTPRTNLITIPIQEDHSGEFRQGQQVTYHHQPTQSGTITYAHAPPPLQHAFNHPPPGHLHQTPIVSYSTAGTQISYSQPLTTQTFTQPPPTHFTHSVPPLQSVVPPAMYSTPPPTAVHQTPNIPPPPAIVQYAPPARYPATSQQPQYDERMPPGTYLPAPPGTGIPSWSGVARASIIPQGSTPVSSVVTQPLQRPHYYS